MTTTNDSTGSVPLYHIELVRDRSVPFKKLSPKDNAIQVMHELLDKSPVEKMLVLHVSSTSELVGVEQVASGQMEMVATSMNDIYRGAILAAVPTIFLCHNHPAGDPYPSPQDLSLTARAIRAGEYLGIFLLDHIIVSPNGTHFSIKDNTHLLLSDIVKEEMEELMRKNTALPPNFPDFGIVPKPNLPPRNVPSVDELKKRLGVLLGRTRF